VRPAGPGVDPSHTVLRRFKGEDAMTRLPIAAILAVLALIGCARDRNVAHTDPPAAERIEFHMRHSEWSHSGLLTLSREAGGTGWTLIDIDDAGARTPLRSGTAPAGAFDEVEEELRREWGLIVGPEPYRVDAWIYRGAQVVRRHNRIGLDMHVKQLLPASESFRQIWEQASGVPKMYWYRDLGPINWEGRSVQQRFDSTMLQQAKPAPAPGE
jgi:hypothetical protein